MIVTCTPSGPVRPRLTQHELLVVLEFDKVKLASGQAHGFFCKSTVSLFVNAMNI